MLSKLTAGPQILKNDGILYLQYSSVSLMGTPQESVADIPSFCQDVEEILPVRLLRNVDVVYMGNFKDLRGIEMLLLIAMELFI